jgi:hypothetical protein
VALVCAGLTLGAGAPAALGAVHDVTMGTSFATIQAAVNAANPGDTLVADAGTYAEQVTVGKSLVLDGPRAGVDARTRTGPEAVVDGTSIGGNTPFRVTANVIIQNGISGLILGSSSSTIRQNLIRNNNASGALTGNGIYTDQFAAGSALTGDTIDSNSFVNDQNAAVLLGSSDATKADWGFTISNNSFTGDGNGILALNLVDSTITGNSLANSLGSQVVLAEGTSNVTVSHNFIQNGSTNGVRVFNEGTGAPAATGVTLACNSITGNSTSGLSVDHNAYAGTLDAGYNWWGSSTGPTEGGNPGGTGQKVIDPDANVSFSHFLLDGTDSDPSTPGFQCEPAVSIADATGREATSVQFTVSLNTPSSSAVTVNYSTVDGTAHAGTDYQATSDSLTFAPGELTKTITVPTTQDNGSGEADETFDVNLSSPSGATLSRGTAVGTIQDVAAPSASIATPAAGATYALNQVVNSSFGCNEGTNGQGLASCVDQANHLSGTAIDTSKIGSHTLTVTGTSQSGRTGTASVSYTVAAAPTASVSSPANGRRYTLGRRVPASFSCSEGAFGPGLESCTGSAANGAPIDTTTPGTHKFAIRAISLDGQRPTRTVTYTVRLPTGITAVHPKRHQEGIFIVTVKLPGPGRVDVLSTAPKRDLATGAALLQPSKGQLVFARAHAIATGPRTLRITATPNAKGERLVAHHRHRVTLQMRITFTPKGGRRAYVIGHYTLHLPG